MDSGVRPPEIVHVCEYGSGPPLLLVHGLMVTGEMFQPVIESFALCHRVIVPDLRGHGKSRGLPGPYDVAQLALDLKLLLDHLGIERTAVLGYSQGGAIAQQMATDFPERCDRLVLACTYAYNMDTLREKMEGRLFPLFIRLFGIKRMARIAVSIGAKHLSRQRAHWLAEMMGNQDQRLMLFAWEAAMAFDGRPRLPEIRALTLVISGSNDKAVPIHHANMLHERIPHSQLVIIEGADHALIWTDADKLVSITKAFLDV